MLIVQPKNKTITTLWNFLESSKYIYYISKRSLQRQTFKTKEKRKKVFPTNNFEKIQNTKIKAPSIFALPHEYKFQIIFNNLLYSLLKNSNINYSYDSFNNLCAYLKDIQLNDKKELYIESDLDPVSIFKIYRIILPADSEYKLIIDIITKYNVNVFYRPDAPDGAIYTYLSVEGAYEVDKFFQASITKSETNNYKLMSFSENFFKTEVNTIFVKINEKRKSLAKMKVSTNNKLLSLVYDTLTSLGQGHLRIFIRCLITLLFKEGDISSDKEEQKVITTQEGRNFYKLYLSYGGLIKSFGEMFISAYYNELSHKKDLKADVIKVFTEILNYISKEKEEERFKQYYNNLITKDPESVVKLSLKTLRGIEKDIIKMLDSKKTLPLDHKILIPIINFHYNFDSLNIKQFEFKAVSHYTKQQMTKIFAVVGEALLELLDSVIFINKADESSIYINNDFYWTTKQSGKYPFFGTKQVTIKDLEETIDENKNKFIYKSLSYTYDQPMINYASKYHIKYVNENFVDQIQNSSNYYVCKLNEGVFIHFLNAISYFMDRKGQINEGFLKYLLPKETNIKHIKNAFDPIEFEKIIDFMCDLSKLSYKEFTKETGIYDLKPLVLSCISYKIEIIQILRILWPIAAFHCWYPRVWADARGRQYPYEMPLNITKSPKWRSLFYYVTYQDIAENTKDHLLKQEDTLKIFEGKLHSRIDVLEEELKKILKKHHGLY